MGDMVADQQHSAIGRAVHWLNDILWGIRMVKAKRFRRRIGFSSRIRFDDFLRPRVLNTDASVIAYPDATYHAKAEDFERATRAATH